MDSQTRNGDVILNALKGRYQRGAYHTWAADVLLVLRPPVDFVEDVAVRQPEEMSEKNPKSDLIQSLAKTINEALLSETYDELSNQTVVLRGVSGSGKTEVCKHFLKTLSQTKGSELSSKISQMFTVLEAFGNAKTTSNGNSSRFAATYTMSFREGLAASVTVTKLLLEPWKVVDRPEGQSNFHVFYYVVAGQDANNNNGSSNNGILKSPIRLLRDQSQLSQQEIESHRDKYHTLMKSVKLLGFGAKEQSDMVLVVQMIMTLGNVTFRRSKSGEAVLEEESKNVLKNLAEAMGLDEEELGDCLCCRKVRLSQEHVTKAYTRDEAEDFLDFLLSTIYSRLFSWLVRSLNDQLSRDDTTKTTTTATAATTTTTTNDLKFIKVVDFPGLESFQANSFEQLMVNLLDDVLHYSFVKNYSILSEDEYTCEGLEWTPLALSANTALIHSLLNEGQFLDSLNKVSRQDKHSVKSAEQLTHHLSEESRNFYQPNPNNPSSFSVVHYGNEKLEYDIRGWSQKLKSGVASNMVSLLRNSENPLLSLLFKAKPDKIFQHSSSPKTPKPQSRSNRSMANHFKSKLSSFLRTFSTTTTTFVCCIRPFSSSSSSSSSTYDNLSVQKQFDSFGLKELVRNYRHVHQHTLAFAEFADRYSSLLTAPPPQPPSSSSTTSTSKDRCFLVLGAFLPGDSWKLGKTKVFLKQQHLWHLNKAVHSKESNHNSSSSGNNTTTNNNNRSQCPTGTATTKTAAAVTTCSGQSAQVGPRNEPTAAGAEPTTTQATTNYVKVTRQSATGNRRRQIRVAPKSIRLYAELDFKEWEKPEQPEQEPQAVKDDSDSDCETWVGPVGGAKSYGEVGARKASARWFLDTQAPRLLRLDDGLYAEWFHGMISRSRADQLLADKQPGCFLVRLAESRFGYTLSFKDKQKCRHYILDELQGGRFKVVGEKVVHSSLAAMVDYYKKNMLSNWDGHLKMACPQVPGESDFDGIMLSSQDIKELREAISRPKMEPTAPPLPF